MNILLFTLCYLIRISGVRPVPTATSAVILALTAWLERALWQIDLDSPDGRPEWDSQ